MLRMQRSENGTGPICSRPQHVWSFQGFGEIMVVWRSGTMHDRSGSGGVGIGVGVGVCTGADSFAVVSGRRIVFL